MTELTIEDIKTGNVEVRAGYETRILATDIEGTHPVCIAFKGSNGWRVLRLTEKGKRSLQEGCHNGYDLVRIPKPKYFNVYTYKTGSPEMGIFFDDLEALAEATQRQADRHRANAKCTQAFQYLDGEVTKVEPEGDE